MLDLALYDRIDLKTRPWAQRLIADTFLRIDYRKIELVFEGLENLPKTPALLALNHTDDYNYWPLQYHMHRTMNRYTAAWVKGKNFESAAVSAFMRTTNNIPLASRGYLLTRDFMSTVGRRPTEREYRIVRDAFDSAEPLRDGVPSALLNAPRSILGRPFDPTREDYITAIRMLLATMMQHFVRLNEQAVARQVDPLVYPQGSRSIRLSKGHGGIGQMAFHLNIPIVPIGCSGGDRIYPTRSPLTRPGRVIYRIGKAILPADIEAHRPSAKYEPFTKESDAHSGSFQAVADLVMNRINGLVDAEYRFDAERQTDGVTGTKRFV